MAFVLKPIDEITIDVHIEIPNGTKRPQKASFKATWHKLTVSEFKELVDRIQDGKENDDSIVHAYLKNISEITDESGKPVEFNEDLIDALMDQNHTRGPLVDSFMLIAGGKEFVEGLRRKN